MIGGVISDIYIKEERNTPMAIFSGAAFFGTGLGPLVSGLIAQNISWRWIYYLQAIMSAGVLILVAIFFQETRGSVLLRRKARMLNNCSAIVQDVPHAIRNDGKDNSSKRIKWEVEEDEGREGLGKTILISLYRPFSTGNFL